LERIVTHIELHRFKNDLKLLGLSQNEIQRVVLGFQHVAHENETVPGSVYVVSQGDVKVELNIQETPFDIGVFRVSEFFVFRMEPEFKVHFSDDFRAWRMEPETFKSLTDHPEVYEFLDVWRERRFEIENSVKKADEDEVSDDEPVEEDDGLEVKDFLKSVPLPDSIPAVKQVHFKQYDQMDCGAACMAMTSHAYGRKINIPVWRSIVHVTREGASMLAIKRGASFVGFDAIGVMTGYKAMKDFRTPFIALMSYHYVVVYEVTDTQVKVADPGTGLLWMSKDAFLKDFSKNCLLVRPTGKLFKFPESAPAYKKYTFLAKDVFFEFSVISAFSVFLFVLSLTPPLFTQFIFDQVLKTGDLKLLNKIGVGVMLLFLFSAVANYIRAIMLARLTNSLGVKLSTLFFRKTICLPFNYFAVRNVGDITTRVSELDKIRSFFSHQMVDIFINLIALVLYSVVFYFYDPRFFWMAVIISFGIFFGLTPVFRRMLDLIQQMFSLVGKNHSIAFEQMRSLKTIQALSGNLHSRWQWEETYDAILKMRDRVNKYVLLLTSGNAAIEQGVALIYLYFSAKLFMSGKLTLGQVVAVSTMSASLIRPILALVQATDQVTNIKVSFDKIDEIVTSPYERLGEKGEVKGGHDDIDFENIWFQYGSDLSPWVLKDLNVKVKAGEKVALVGPSGSGKSTLAYMLNLVYRPTKGTVKIGGVPNSQIPLTELRSRVSMILQDNAIFPGTVVSNIAFGDEFPNLDRVVRAAKIAEAHDFVTQLPLGYSTVLGEGDKDLSGGQKQRISIARAIYKAPEILVLDEATSALDSVTERKVIQNLKMELKNTTCFTIAHRLNTIIDSDRILVISKGKLVEEGRHEELLKRQGVYFNLFRKQISQ
jgi:ATP-binding cassette subfamily B protein